MAVNVETLEKLERRITLTLASDDVNKEVEARLKKLSRTVKADGFRPIVLTAAAAVLAMIPLSESVFWGPMAVAIMGGLVIATALTLLALPAMYAAWFRVRREAPAEATAVEPAVAA